MPPNKLAAVVDALHEMYGSIRPQVTDPFEMILLENVAYLVDDAKRFETFAKLRKNVGSTPRAILAHTANEIGEVIAGGGMQPLMRAGKVLEAARVAETIALENLDAVVSNDARAAKQLLRRFPSVGEPSADRILLFAGSQITLAPDSNALRVLVRLGFAREEKNYSKMYRSAISATSGFLENISFAQRAHLLLRKHGQELCKRSAPRCELCPLRSDCVWYRDARPSGAPKG